LAGKDQRIPENAGRGRTGLIRFIYSIGWIGSKHQTADHHLHGTPNEVSRPARHYRNLRLLGGGMIGMINGGVDEPWPGE